MELTKEEGRNVVYGDHPDWETVKGSRNIINQGRWDTTFEAVFLHKPSDKYYKMIWREGSTEQQEHQVFEYEDPKLVEVELKEVMVKQWVSVG